MGPSVQIPTLCRQRAVAVYGVSLHLMESIVVSGSDDSTIRVWDIDKGKCLGTYIGHQGYGEDIGSLGKNYKLSRQFAGVWKIIHVGDNGKSIASCSYDRTITIWDVRDVLDVKITCSWRAADNGIFSISMVSPQCIASCAADKEFRIWTLDGQLLRSVRVERGLPCCAQILNENL